MRNRKVRILCECAIMVALAFAMSCIKLFQMPLGGSVTLASMLPIMLISIRHGTVIGLGTGFVYSITQLIQAIAEGDVFIYCETAGIVVLCVLFDYIIPFTALGLAGIFRDLKIVKKSELACYIGFVLAVFTRFVCHYITGVAIWGQWAEMNKYLYSFLYNGSYLGVDLIICLAVSFFMIRSKEIKKILSI